MELPTYAELEGRIKDDIDHYGGKLPDLVSVAWSGYLGALLEWGLLSVTPYSQLLGLLPPVKDNPMAEIFLGRTRE